MKRRKFRPGRKSPPAKRGAKARQRKSSRAPTARSDPIDAFVTAGARALGISIDPSWQKSVAFNLRLIMQHATRVDEFALPDEAEPAPVFRA